MRMVWLVYVVDGKPVRLWSDDATSKMNCHYRQDNLVTGSHGVLYAV